MPSGDDFTNRVIRFAIAIHRALGPGLLESAYERCLCFELARAGLRFERQVPVSIVYEGQRLDAGFRADIIIEDEIIIELKAAQAILPIHEAQLLTYLRLSGIRIGLLLNFNMVRMKDGIRRFVV